MKKIYLFLLIILVFLNNISCTSADRNKSLINYDEYYTDNLYPDYRNNPDSKYLSQNQNLINYLRYNNIDEYNYTISGNTLKIWINNFENMTEDQKTKIKNDLNKLYKSIEIIKNEKDLK